MVISRRTLVRGLGAGVLGAGALSACTRGGRRGRQAETTAPTGEELTEPDTPLVLGSIGASYGRSAAFEAPIGLALHEAMIDLNKQWEGLFGHEVTMADRHVMKEAGEDLSEVIAGFAEAGVTAVITSIDEEALVAAIPAFVEAGIAVIDVFTSGMSVRAPEVQTSNMLIRLAPNDVALAALYAEASWEGGSDKSGSPGTVAFVSEDTAHGHSLREELSRILDPNSGKVIAEHFYPAGKMGKADPVVKKVLKTPPALLVVNGGPEVGPFLSALHEATLDDRKRPTVEFARRLSPASSVDYSEAKLAAETLSEATGHLPGAELTVEHVNMMLNADPELEGSSYGYSQQGYDAVMLAALAAQDALSVEGVDIAGSVEKVLTGTEECTNYGDCSSILRTGLQSQERASVSYTGRTGPLELGSAKDPRTGKLRTFTWNEANAIVSGGDADFEAPE
ncbi:ABC transporter substrate-binding protein [Brachybacterium sacelli]|uniref:Branched-chain amino acid transport system substrate-binding protein n=1 Tax=Brachybacterium sacelli TaxID=173364 RepID=A0ABS4X2Q0_9MICO|nr:ABC transporter substrate-binding protein [Brachybacterium sacelli]MBP2382697.1 branched-chain amino acid transport system substrate-binding protein [Brachybacterium sacelli]